ncbi:MAG: MogA/MoaB family molybdenum cofactor biosynthesis protein [Fusobacteriaceae bacterium]
MYTAAIVCLSDKGSVGEREDTSTGVIEEILLKNKFEISEKILISDEYIGIVDTLERLCENEKINLILTTGGTGFSFRDNTPEATKKVIQKEVPGISEAIRAYSMTITKRAMLSRGVSGIKGKTLIINLPGSPKAVRESLEYIIDTITHGIDLIIKGSQDCARK